MKQTLTIVADSITEAYDMVRSYNETLRLNNNAVWPLNAEWTVTHIKKGAQWAVTLYCMRDDELDPPPVVKDGGYGYLTMFDLEKRCDRLVEHNTGLVKDNSELNERIEAAMKRQHCLVTARDNAVDNARKIADDFASAEVKWRQENKAAAATVEYWNDQYITSDTSRRHLGELLIEEQKKYNAVREELKKESLRAIKWCKAWNDTSRANGKSIVKLIEKLKEMEQCRDAAEDNARKIADDFARAEVTYRQETKLLRDTVDYWRDCARKEAASSSDLHKLLVEEQKKYNAVREELKEVTQCRVTADQVIRAEVKWRQDNKAAAAAAGVLPAAACYAAGIFVSVAAGIGVFVAAASGVGAPVAVAVAIGFAVAIAVAVGVFVAVDSTVEYWKDQEFETRARHQLLLQEQKKYNDVREELKDLKLKHIELFKDWNKQGRDMMDLMQTHCEMSKLIDMCVPFGYTPGQDFEAFRSWLYKQLTR